MAPVGPSTQLTAVLDPLGASWTLVTPGGVIVFVAVAPAPGAEVWVTVTEVASGRVRLDAWVKVTVYVLEGVPATSVTVPTTESCVVPA